MTELKLKIKIGILQVNQRIDKFLADCYRKKSRANWQKIIKNGMILVNNKKIKSDYILKKDDELKILEIIPEKYLTPPQKKEESQKIEIIYKDKNVIVINKPAGVLSQVATSSKSLAVSDFLVKRFPEIKEVCQAEQRYGIVHRLDKNTSGVMIVARNNESFKFLKSQFKNRKTQKTYIALVYGIIKPKEGIIDLKIGRSKTNPLMQTVIDCKKKENIKSREAITQFKTLKFFKCYSLLEVSPKTGRMHQIRVHLKSLGFPIVGDKKYFFRKYKKVKPILDHQFLHASKLKIKLPNNKITIFQSSLPKNLKEFLDKISRGQGDF